MLLDYNFNDEDRNNTYSLYEGYIRGNMFKDLYKPYKNYKIYNIKTTNKKEEALLEIMMLEFAINDLNLYLIINPDDKELFKKYKEYMDIYIEKRKQYEDTFNMLNLENEKDYYTYLKNPLPWEVKNV